MQFLIRELAFVTTVLSSDPPKSPLKKGTLSKSPVPPFEEGLFHANVQSVKEKEIAIK